MTHALVTRYLTLLEGFACTPEAFAGVLHPAIEQVEYPNALNPRGQVSDAADLYRRAALAPQVLAAQRYAVANVVDGGGTLFVEADWTGELRDGRKLEARFGMVLELEDGLIRRQRNYDCFLPL